MTDTNFKAFIDTVFNEIKIAKSIGELKGIEERTFEPKYQMDVDAYPKIEFSIKSEEIADLQKQGILNADYTLSNTLTKDLNHPLSKLLYALAWKNGDLKKLKHIAKGIAEIDKTDAGQDEALVFYQFGRHLTKTDGQPIIDQHVIRAFAVYQLEEENDMEPYLKLSVITAKHKPMIKSYINWLQSYELSSELKAQKDYSYYIDRILFAAGRMIKQRKS
ncbi:hypothetical protein [Carboxylicivirga sp. N1Y90]|uniref:hypothetical protein n=1 Tax=Carboxylicivirga fragile TaxID=3417571 RepID=UPI003D3595F5|nr:hypothetical protein [Marinilabiliaceae bacterium N1Y90]